MLASHTDLPSSAWFVDLGVSVTLGFLAYAAAMLTVGLKPGERRALGSLVGWLTGRGAREEGLSRPDVTQAAPPAGAAAESRRVRAAAAVGPGGVGPGSAAEAPAGAGAGAGALAWALAWAGSAAVGPEPSGAAAASAGACRGLDPSRRRWCLRLSSRGS